MACRPPDGLPLATARQRAVKQYVDCNELRLGDRIALVRLRQLRAEVVVLNPRAIRFIGDFERMLAAMPACDLFIVGDTWPSPVYALLCPDRPQISIYPSMASDRKTCADLQRALGLPLPRNSLPLRLELNVIELAARRTLAWKGIRPRARRVGRFDASQVALLANRLVSNHAQ